MSRRLVICCTVMLATLVFPGHARAGLADIIWEMSGPQMIGVLVRCRVPFHEGPTQCGVQLPLNPEPQAAANGQPAREVVWLALEGGAYVSTGHNSGGNDYKFGHIGMLTFEPMLEIGYAGDIARAYEKDSQIGAVYGGIGPMINRFLVKGPAESFTKYGVKLRPIAIAFSGWALEYNIRIYPEGFTPDEFGFGPRLDINRPFEAVQSVSVSVPWLKWKLGK